jgi:hypothetical protein
LFYQGLNGLWVGKVNNTGGFFDKENAMELGFEPSVRLPRKPEQLAECMEECQNSILLYWQWFFSGFRTIRATHPFMATEYP